MNCVCLRCGRQEREGNFQMGSPPKLEGPAGQGMAGSGLGAVAPVPVTSSFLVNHLRVAVAPDLHLLLGFSLIAHLKT